MTNAIKTNHTMPNLKGMPYGGAWSIHDSETVDLNRLQNLMLRNSVMIMLIG
jgi:hypothetical protein